MLHSEQAGPQQTRSERESATPATADSQAHETPTYSVSTWDHDVQGWRPHVENATKWQLRNWLRTLYGESWDCVSILVERN